MKGIYKIFKVLKHQKDNKDYKLLYEYALKAYEEKLEIYRKLDEKTFKFAYILSFLSTILFFMLNFFINDVFCIKCFTDLAKNKCLYSYAIVRIVVDSIIILVFIYSIMNIFFAIKNLLISLKPKDRKSIPINKEVVTNFNRISEKEFIIGLSKNLEEVTIELIKLIKAKSGIINLTFNYMRKIVYSLLINFVLIFLDILIKNFRG